MEVCDDRRDSVQLLMDTRAVKCPEELIAFKALALSYAIIFSSESQVVFTLDAPGEYLVHFTINPTFPKFMTVKNISQLTQRPIKAQLRYSTYHDTSSDGIASVDFPGSTFDLVGQDGTLYDEFYKNYDNIPELASALTEFLRKKRLVSLRPNSEKIAALSLRMEDLLRAT